MVSNDWITVAKITTVFGIKGWLKIHSYTEPGESLFAYKDMQLWEPHKDFRQTLEFDQYQAHGKGYIAHIKGCDDRNSAERFTKQEIQIPRDSLENLQDGDYYWHELEGLEVWSRAQQQSASNDTNIDNKEDALQCLGVVSHLIETGANDVLVVQPSASSIDKRERLIPYLDHVVIAISLEDKRIELEWDPEF